MYGQFPQGCDHCGEAGKLNFCGECFSLLHDECFLSHKCLETEEENEKSVLRRI